MSVLFELRSSVFSSHLFERETSLASISRNPMNQLYLCEEPYWSRYAGSEMSTDDIKINIISDGKKCSCALFHFNFSEIKCPF